MLRQRQNIKEGDRQSDAHLSLDVLLSRRRLSRVSALLSIPVMENATVLWAITPDIHARTLGMNSKPITRCQSIITVSVNPCRGIVIIVHNNLGTRHRCRAASRGSYRDNNHQKWSSHGRRSFNTECAT